MEPTILKGVSRVLGEEQGYKPLPVADGYIPAGGGRLPVMQTAWAPSPEELVELNKGGVVVLTIVGTTHPPIIVEACEAFTQPDNG